MALDIGLATGLAYKHDFQKDIRNRSMIQQLKRQKKIDNQNEARLWAKELETIAVQNPYDAAGLEKYLDGHFKKAGKWLQEHPNFRENPSEFLTWTSKFVKPIKDNEFVRRDLSFQEQKKLYSQYVAKYGKDHPKTELMSKQMESYRTMGNIDGDPTGGVKEFMFSAPYDGFDPLETISTYFGKLRPSGEEAEFKNGMWFYNASYDEKKAVASQMVADPNLRGMWDEWWTNMDDSQRRGKNMLDHIIEVGSPFVNPKVRTPAASTGGGRGTTDTKAGKTIYDNDVGDRLEAEYYYNKKYGGPGWQQVQGSAQGTNAVMQNENEEIDILDGSIMGVYNVNDANTQANLKQVKSMFKGLRKATATGNHSIRDIKGKKQSMAEVEVFVGLQEMDDLNDENVWEGLWEGQGLLPEGVEDRQPIDYDFFETGWNNPDEMNDVHIMKPYRDIISKVADPEDPDRIIGYNVKTWVPINMDHELNKQAYSGDVTTKVKPSYSETFTKEEDPNIIETNQGYFRKVMENGQVRWAPVR